MRKERKAVDKEELKSHREEIEFRIFQVAIYLVFFSSTFFFAYIIDKIPEVCICYLSFCITRYSYGKTFHLSKTSVCLITSIALFCSLGALSVSRRISIIISSALGFGTSTMLFILRDWLDYKEVKNRNIARTIYKGIPKEILYNIAEKSSLNEIEAKIVIMYYSERKSLNEISDEVGYSYYYCSHIKRSALNKITTLPNKR